ncbi:MAG: bifunctional nuclease family protein [Treponema sp.]|nr:bifunctional nuclease family protein [Treponema sp.]
MLEAEIWGVAETGDGFMIFIKPHSSEYSVPIFIGQLEAQAILIGFGGISISRPLTADLLQNFVKEANFELLRMEITDLKENTFFGSLVFKKPTGEEFIIDSRPSDALALAVRCKSPIFIDEKVVETAGIITEDLTTGKEQTARRALLQNELEEAIAVENYERAAEIRDILKSLEK